MRTSHEPARELPVVAGTRAFVSAVLLAVSIVSVGSLPAHARVTFDSSGTALVDGVPFFPVGVFLYGFDTDVLAEVLQQGFNTVVYAVTPRDLDTLKIHGLMTIPYPTEEWLAVKDHPSILSWYLYDEPEGHGKSPEDMRREYERVHTLDPTRPIGLCHFLWNALERYKDSADFVMSDVYPVLAKRTQGLTPVSDHIDRLHHLHGPGFPVWAAIQVFGGPETEGGKWAAPTPIEVRCMTYLALAHGAKGVLFFSYWPKLPRTWAEVGALTRELHRLTPFLTTPARELRVESRPPALHVRCLQTGKAGIVLAVNTEARFQTASFKIPDLRTRDLALPFENRRLAVPRGIVTDRFMPYDAHVYQWGATPTSLQAPIRTEAQQKRVP